MSLLFGIVTGSKSSKPEFKKNEGQAKSIEGKIKEMAAQKAESNPPSIASRTVAVENIPPQDKNIALFAMQCILLDLLVVDKQGSEKERVEKTYRSILRYEEPVVQKEEGIVSIDEELDQMLPPLTLESDATEENTPLPVKGPAKRSFPWLF